MNFKDKVVVVTGGSKGFGKALAGAFKNVGAKVIISSESTEGLSAAAMELGIEGIVADVSVKGEVEDLTSLVLDKYDRIDVWINNAGIQIAPSNIEDVNVDKLHNLFAINFFGYYYGMQSVIPIMRQQVSGMIVNINSTAGLNGKPGISAYVGSKFAVKGLTESARTELNDTAITVFGIYPGGMQTEIYKEAYPPDFDEYMSVDYAVDKIMANFKSAEPELDLIIRRPAKS